MTASNRASSKVALYANGQAVGVTRSSNYASSERSYFGTDLMGTVRSSTTDSGNAEYYEYDVFGKPYGESVSDYAYTGKPYDPVTGMYNYGYRDYVPQTARFSTIDPIRDGSNWFAYCNNEPVNFLDAWGLMAGDVTFSPDLFDLNRPAPFSDWGVYPGQEVLNGSREGYLATIQSLVGTNYVWGGNDPITDGGLDCSGAVLYGINQQGNTVQ